MAEAPFDVPRAQRWFAVEFNNLAWDLVEAETRSDADVARMIHAAHAACIHWQAAGTALNHARAECLLTAAYVAAGYAEAAVRHAERTLALGEAVADEQTPFDRATIHAGAAAAYALAGQPGPASAQRALAEAAAASIRDPSARAVFDKLYPAP